MSPKILFEISNEPPSDTKTAESISASFPSWLTSILRSVKTSQVLSDIETNTVGEKSIQDM